MTIPEFADPFQVFKTMQGTRRLLFFDGAPQSGRTFLAAVTAIYLADCGYRTLLLPVDPPAWLEQALEKTITPELCPTEALAQLWTFRPESRVEASDFDLYLLAQLACVDDQSNFDFIVLNRVPGLEAVSSAADACQGGGVVEKPPSGPAGIPWPTDRQWRALLPRLWDVHTAMFIAVTSPDRFHPEELAAKMEEIAATGIHTGLIVANRLPLVKDCIFPDDIREFLKELSGMDDRFNIPIADMPMAGEKEIDGSLDLLERARIFFGPGSRPWCW